MNRIGRPFGNNYWTLFFLLANSVTQLQSSAMWRILEEFPPVAVRLLARTGKGLQTRPLTDREIANSSGLPENQVRGLSEFYTWRGVPIDIAYRFVTGCGIRFDDYRSMKRHRQYRDTYLASSKSYLRRDAAWESRWKPMLIGFAAWSERNAVGGVSRNAVEA